jgi:hypothetical protein
VSGYVAYELHVDLESILFNKALSSLERNNSYQSPGGAAESSPAILWYPCL